MKRPLHRLAEYATLPWQGRPAPHRHQWEGRPAPHRYPWQGRPAPHCLHRLIEYAALLGAAFTLAGLLGAHLWAFELFTHFKLQLAACFLFYAVLESLARHTHHAAAGCAFAAVNALPVLLLCLPPVSRATAAAPAAATLRILQANILSSNSDPAPLRALIARENPDVIVLQEPNARWLRDLAGLTNAYPVSAAEPREDNFGAAIFCRANVRSAEIVHLNDPERAPSTRARIEIGGRTLTVMGTHPLAPCSAYAWRGRNDYILQLARLLCDTEGPRVVTGDFNTTPWSASFRAFLAVSGLRDSAQGRAPQLTWPSFNPPFARIPIDHCLHSREVTILDRRLGPDIGSDHLPLIIDLAFTESTEELGIRN
jgi:endonuclease/exonuclease/phosphatase (EEP) superfamily protein YafD